MGNRSSFFHKVEIGKTHLSDTLKCGIVGKERKKGGQMRDRSH